MPSLSLPPELKGENMATSQNELKTFSKITYADGEWCVCKPGAVEDMTTGCEGFTVEEVQMTEAEFNALPEFQG